MSEAAEITTQPEQDAATQVAEAPTPIDKRARDKARLKKAAMYHGAAAVAALTLFGAADTWATLSGLNIAWAVSVLAAVVSGYMLAFMAHEWGHFTGARVTGARSPVARELQSFFMFGFDMKRNSLNQFLSMSCGGPIANWLAVVAVIVLFPLNTVAQAMLLATVTAIAVNVCIFELPVIQQTMSGEDPAETISRRQEALKDGQPYGWITGGVVWLATVYFLV